LINLNGNLINCVIVVSECVLKSPEVGTRWNEMERDGTRWNEMERDGTRWNEMERDGMDY